MPRGTSLTLLLAAAVVVSAEYEDEDGVYGGDVVEMDRDAQIANIELEVAEARRAAEPFRVRYASLQEQQKRSDSGWFFQGKEAKAMQPYVDEAFKEWMGAQREVDILRAQIKPLYGVVSVQHFQEHQDAVHETFQRSVEMGQNQMVWDMILGRGDSDSLESVLLNMLFSFLAGASIGYFIGFVKFLFTAPFTIYQYCSSILDVPAALFMWVVGLTLFLLPLLAVYYTCILVTANRRRQGGGYAPPPRPIHMRRY